MYLLNRISIFKHKKQSMKTDVSKLKWVPNEHEIKIAERSIEDFLVAMGNDVKREGLKETPKRYTKFMKEFCNPEKFEFTTFEGEGYDEMIIVKDIPFYSLCEHHLAPFFGVGHIAYIPDNNRIVGLSKIPRTLDMFARRPQNQERISMQVAEFLMENLKAKGVGVILEARHMCVEMRGVKKSGCMTQTSALLGCFKEAATKQEFINLIKK